VSLLVLVMSVPESPLNDEELASITGCGEGGNAGNGGNGGNGGAGGFLARLIGRLTGDSGLDGEGGSGGNGGAG
jgi:hypothetical protein